MSKVQLTKRQLKFMASFDTSRFDNKSHDFPLSWCELDDGRYEKHCFRCGYGVRIGRRGQIYGPYWSYCSGKWGKH